eukprot:1648829-Pyramimonas_sp.AAC.1
MMVMFCLIMRMLVLCCMMWCSAFSTRYLVFFWYLAISAEKGQGTRPSARAQGYHRFWGVECTLAVIGTGGP